MKRVINDLLEPHCDLLIKDGNSKCLSSLLKKQLKKMEPQVHRVPHHCTNDGRAMAIIFLFNNGCKKTTVHIINNAFMFRIAAFEYMIVNWKFLLSYIYGKLLFIYPFSFHYIF